MNEPLANGTPIMRMRHIKFGGCLAYYIVKDILE